MKAQKQAFLFYLVVVTALISPLAHATACTTESQMSASERTALENFARSLGTEVQQGNAEGVRAQTLPAVAGNFAGIAATIQRLKPLIGAATITVDDLYALDASTQTANSPATQFFCGTRIVTLNFHNLPPGKYAYAIVHATGVPKPQQLSMILSQDSPNHWMLAGFLSKPMALAGHGGLWYWEQAREYASRKQDWAAWFYYRAAADLLSPAPFLASPNLQKLNNEMNAAKPSNLPNGAPAMLNVNGASYELMNVGTTTTFGTLDLEVDYQPSTAQLAELHNPVTARSQVIAVMTALLTEHPELRTAFHGIWVRANQGNATIFALDLPMDQIPGGSASPQT